MVTLTQQADFEDGVRFVFEIISVQPTEDEDLNIRLTLECERGYLGTLTVDYKTYRALAVRLLCYSEEDVPVLTPTTRYDDETSRRLWCPETYPDEFTI